MISKCLLLRVTVRPTRQPGRGNRCSEAKQWPASMFQVVHYLREAFKDRDLLGESALNIRGEKTVKMIPTVFLGHSVGALVRVSSRAPLFSMILSQQCSHSFLDCI
jgi:hypothetical protein